MDILIFWCFRMVQQKKLRVSGLCIRHTQTAPVSIRGCLEVSDVVCCRLLGFNDASLPSHRWTDYWPPSEIIVSDYWSSQKTSQINRSRWLRKIIAAMVMFTLKTPQNLKDPSKIPQNLQKPTQNLQNYGKKPKTSKNPQKLPKTSKLYKHR